MEAAALTQYQAEAIAEVLVEAGMPVRVRAWYSFDQAGRQIGGGPVFTNCTGTQVMAAITSLIARHSYLGDQLAAMDWLTVSFEERSGEGGFASTELGWTR